VLLVPVPYSTVQYSADKCSTVVNGMEAILAARWSGPDGDDDDDGWMDGWMDEHFVSVKDTLAFIY